MWIPQKYELDPKDLKLLFDKVVALVDGDQILQELYQRILESFATRSKLVPPVLRVETDRQGFFQIDPFEAHFLYLRGMLGDEKPEVRQNLGLTGYSRTYHWRELDVDALRAYLAKIPAPK